MDLTKLKKISNIAPNLTIKQLVEIMDISNNSYITIIDSAINGKINNRIIDNRTTSTGLGDIVYGTTSVTK